MVDRGGWIFDVWHGLRVEGRTDWREMCGVWGVGRGLGEGRGGGDGGFGEKGGGVLGWERERRGEKRRGEERRDDGGVGVWGLEAMMLWGGGFGRGVLEGDC